MSTVLVIFDIEFNNFLKESIIFFIVCYGLCNKMILIFTYQCFFSVIYGFLALPPPVVASPTAVLNES